MFGADSVERKYGAKPPEEWVAMLTRLKDRELDRGIRRLAYSGKAHVPSLPEFTRMCRAVGDDGIEEGPRPIALPNPDDGKFDGWAVTANNRFWKYITKRLTDHPLAWGAAGSTKHADATRIAVGYKNAWAQDMREGGTLDKATGELAHPSTDVQNSAWAECMRRAEADISAGIAERRAA
jgi:hypothetical protein